MAPIERAKGKCCKFESEMQSCRISASHTYFNPDLCVISSVLSAPSKICLHASSLACLSNYIYQYQHFEGVFSAVLLQGRGTHTCLRLLVLLVILIGAGLPLQTRVAVRMHQPCKGHQQLAHCYQETLTHSIATRRTLPKPSVAADTRIV